MKDHGVRRLIAAQHPLSRHFPPFMAVALADALHESSEADRIAMIDAITDRLCADGLVRNREDDSMNAVWRAKSGAAMRETIERMKRGTAA
jgi:hypothetical protein